MSVFENQQAQAAPEPSKPLTQEDRDAILSAILAEQQANRAEVATLRAELEKAKTTPVAQPLSILTQEQLLEQRMAEVAKHNYYCPGCGQLYDYQTKCSGSAEKPHPPIEVVSTDELHSGDPSRHTPAPATVNLG